MEKGLNYCAQELLLIMILNIYLHSSSLIFSGICLMKYVVNYTCSTDILRCNAKNIKLNDQGITNDYLKMHMDKTGHCLIK